MSFYRDDDKLYVAVDCIIFGFDESQIKLLIFERRVQPLYGHWSLIGTFVKKAESVREAAERVVKESTGLDRIFLEEVGTYGNPNRDPGARVISIAHYALIRVDEYQQTFPEKYRARWFAIDRIPDLVLDHERMVQDALEKLRRKARYRPIGFELLPEKFTIPQLKKLYDAIYQRELDRRNFRKKILAMKILKKLNEKDRSSRKGAYLYQFNENMYRSLLEDGIDFRI